MNGFLLVGVAILVPTFILVYAIVRSKPKEFHTFKGKEPIGLNKVSENTLIRYTVLISDESLMFNLVHAKDEYVDTIIFQYRLMEAGRRGLL